MIARNKQAFHYLEFGAESDHGEGALDSYLSDVSTGKQTVDNQRIDLEAAVAHHGWTSLLPMPTKASAVPMDATSALVDASSHPRQQRRLCTSLQG
jgi:hypothetical protein